MGAYERKGYSGRGDGGRAYVRASSAPAVLDSWWEETSTGYVFGYDPTLSKWVSREVIQISAAANAIASGLYLDVEGATSDPTEGFVLPSPAPQLLLHSVTVQTHSSNHNLGRGLDVIVDGSAVGPTLVLDDASAVDNSGAYRSYLFRPGLAAPAGVSASLPTLAVQWAGLGAPMVDRVRATLYFRIMRDPA